MIAHNIASARIPKQTEFQFTENQRCTLFIYKMPLIPHNNCYACITAIDACGCDGSVCNGFACGLWHNYHQSIAISFYRRLDSSVFVQWLSRQVFNVHVLASWMICTCKKLHAHLLRIPVLLLHTYSFLRLCWQYKTGKHREKEHN